MSTAATTTTGTRRRHDRSQSPLPEPSTPTIAALAPRGRKRPRLLESPSDNPKRRRPSQQAVPSLSPHRGQHTPGASRQHARSAPTSPIPSPNHQGKGGRPPERVQPTPSTALRCLACPFYKRSPSQHRSCAHANLSKLSYVKQHLTRKHAPSIQCSRCYETFREHGALDKHSRLEPPCKVVQERPKDPSSAMTNEQLSRLRPRANPAQSETEQWEEIWNILFPGIPMPASAYIDLDLPDEVNDLIEYMAQYVPPRIIAELELDEEGLSRRLAELVLGVADQWVEKRRNSSHVLV